MQYLALRLLMVWGAGVGLSLGAAAPALAQQGIYTCIDAKGRRITADRPITECLDREQRELTPSGTVKRRVGPSLTAEERAAEELRAARALEETKRIQEEKKRERALIARYPDRATHDRERAASLALIDGVIATANKHRLELEAQRRKLDVELEFFKGDASKVPFKLKRQIEENTQAMESQRRFIANHDLEKQRLNARYDEELVKLKAMWAQLGVAAPRTAAAVASGPARR
ncbi:MAG: DUF4124 domain-containing protein [Pseudomonadota bacterium]